jgi:hypothetical protein
VNEKFVKLQDTLFKEQLNCILQFFKTYKFRGYSLNFRYCEKAAKFGKISPIFFKLLKTVAFNAVKKYPAVQKNFIRFYIENLIANISFYVLSWLKLNFRCYLTFEIIF